MTKTSLEVCTEAARMIGVAAEDEQLTADMIARFQLHLSDLFEMINGNPYNLGFTWSLEEVPNGVVLPLARLLAGSIAGSYGLDNYTPLYGAGLDGVRKFAARDLSFQAHTQANFF